MTYLVERLAELRRHLRHLSTLAPRVTSRESLERDMSLRNDVLFSLSTRALDPIDRFCRIVADIEGDDT